MPNTIIVGTQWGDEGKGKIVDFLTETTDVVVRAQGGANAGHTVYNQGEKYVLHLMPSGILWPSKECVIGNGVVIDPLGFIEEIEGLEAKGLSVTAEQLKISSAAHVVFPYHRKLDQLREARRGKGKLGTTGRGIGPAYADKIDRCGLRVNDLIQPERLAPKLRARLEQLQAQYPEETDLLPEAEATLESYHKAGERLRPHVTNTIAFLHEAMRSGKELLFEGAQGAYLDIDHGTYPFVTSSNTTAGGACTGSGVSPTRIAEVIGVCKAYTTRVGAGPCVTENQDFSERLHAMGREFGATTGRKRRCGWLDGVMLRFTTMVNGLTQLAITNLDGLDGLDTVKICTAYEFNGERLELPPIDAEDWEQCEPVYEELPGWSEDITESQSLDDLPANARAYLDRIAELTATRIGIVSVGPRPTSDHRLRGLMSPRSSDADDRSAPPEIANVPQHVAIIMDGNGRWAKEQGKPRTEGHRAGAETVRACAAACGDLGIRYLTLYAFSSENWKRPPSEIKALMALLERFLKTQTKEMEKRNIRLQAIGRLTDLPPHCQDALHDSIQRTASNDGLNLILALNYGGREEIIDGVRSVLRHVKEGLLDEAMLDPEIFSKHLYTRYYPDPDLLIRTSGELRISNFLLWQISYAEIVISKKFWPEFKREDFFAAVEEYSKRQRRFGGL